MSARTEIRSLTYPKLAIQPEFSKKKWIHPNDEVFNKFGELIKEQKHIPELALEEDKISDFLNLFYYFIICYSKQCFKKNGNWDHPRYKQYYKNNRPYPNEQLPFNYELANETKAHTKLLEIQRRMNLYRHEYKSIADNYKLYFTNDKKREIKLFIEESLDIICTDIQEPVLMISYDVKAKITKYAENIQHRKKIKKSTKLNYAVLDAICVNIS